MTVSNVSNVASLFTRLDVNGDGKISKTEFITGRPGGATASQALSAFDEIDAANTGSITEDQLSKALDGNASSGTAGLQGNLSSSVMATLLQMVQSVSTATTDDSGQDLTAQNIFNTMDTNGDGKVTEDEFVAAKPPGMTDDDAKKLYKSIDTQGMGSITLSQFENSDVGQNSEMASLHGHGHGGGGGSQQFDPLDTNKDGYVSLDELLSAAPEDLSEDQQAELKGTDATAASQYASNSSAQLSSLLTSM